ncbi:DUF6236 family protein [Paracoccus sulfuroxidans]|uniref:Uncharacterized protein n=1 Tax=Paracoccus sulfuroxidans TaxID=384678 RepID=A0A562NC59_9RHOB|nr:DUF6236 family protein [Paracoccus sulfuroxidans]TWI29759.1 hypothetical protein IQ24_03576 [Paracoccus sulfuroxidans]
MGKSHFRNTTFLTNPFQKNAQFCQLNTGTVPNAGTSVWPDSSSFDFEINNSNRGIILSNPMRISGTSVSIESSDLDASELRRALLFWDVIAWPASSGIYICGGPDIDFLLSEKRLIRPKFHMNGDAATGLSMAFSQTLKILEGKMPGQWIMSNGESSLSLSGKDLLTDRGVLTTLSNLIPIPMHDMPLEEVLRFRDARLPEVLALRSALDRLYQDWMNSEDKEHQLKMAINDLDIAISAMIKVARESKNPFTLSSWEMSFSFSAIDAFKGFFAGKIFGLDTASSLLAGAASTISFSKGVGLKSAKSNSPFTYISSIHNKLL